MRLSLTFSYYISRQFLIGVAMVFLIFIATIFVFDAVEMMRRGSGPDRELATLGILLQMAMLRIPFMAQKILPFAALVAGLWTFGRMTRTQELVVARAAGVSVWQFLLPTLLLALILGVFVMTVFNPLSAAMVSRYEHMDAKYLRGKSSLLALSPAGIWLRQVDGGNQSVIHAQRLSQEDLTLHDVIIFQFQENDQFVGRIDASQARLEEGRWELNDVVLTGPDRPAQFKDSYDVPTSLTFAQIEDSFAPPETLSFWALPDFIEVLEASGFSAVRHRLYWHSLLSGPLLLCAMVLIAATFSLRFSRSGGTWLLIAAGVLSGFVLYFVSDLVLALGLSGKIPPVLAAWTPAGVFTLIGVASLFHLEDG
ncbi:MAG: LPS export ABC transporter permease LptG [Alphaproteobacteria bacterium]